MSLSHRILTVLSIREATGYDITKELSYSIVSFWKASHQQVYRDLHKIANNNWVTFRIEPQKGKPDRKVYSITDLGRISLFEWFQKPIRNPTIRDVFTAKLLICGIHHSEPMQHQMEDMIEELQSELSYQRELECTQFSNYKELGRQARLERLILRRAIYNRQAWILWAEEVLSEFKEIDRPDMWLRDFEMTHRAIPNQ